ncbi:MAG: hypothetical protein K0R41_2376 [Geminicoccaceae bacterium]|jgi:hypothetical protein|nr:hypothetical protein [Geminicoccaceae bacterium]
MQDRERVAAVVEIVDEFLGELVSLGCSPVESGAALLSAGLAEIREEPNSAEVVGVYQIALAHICADLNERRAGAGSAMLH